MTVTLNPLVASRLEGPPDAYAGVWAAEDLELLTQGIAGHDWVDAGLGGLGAGLDALGFGADPARHAGPVRSGLAHRARPSADRGAERPGR